jgi:hypothetical protein
VPPGEGLVGGVDGGGALVAAVDDLEEEVGVAGVVGEVADLVEAQELGAGAEAEALLEGVAGVALAEVGEQGAGGGEERGDAAQDGLVAEVLGEHGLADAVGAQEHEVVGLGDEVEAEILFEDPLDGAAIGDEPVEGSTTLDGMASPSAASASLIAPMGAPASTWTTGPGQWCLSTRMGRSREMSTR